jgi:hypothetical protein
MTRQPTPDIMADLLGPVHDDTKLIRAELRYDYGLIPAEQRNQVQAAAVEIVQAGRRAQDDLMKIGQRLVEVKELLEHGQFQEWCATEFQMTARTARNMMNVAKVFGDKTETVSVLSDSAMYLLAAPSTPEEARVEVIAQAQAAGKTPTKAEVVETIKKHQPNVDSPAQRINGKQQSPPAATTVPLDPWAAAALTPGSRQYRAMAIAEAITPWIREYRDTYGRDWHTLAQHGNPSHSNSTFWQDIGRELRRRSVIVHDDTLKMAIKEAFGWLLLSAKPPTGKPMIDVLRTDDEQALDALEQEIASRNAAADEAERQAAADPYDHTDGDGIRNDLAALDSARIAAEAAQVEAAEQAEARRRVIVSVQIGKPMVEWTAADWAKYEGKQAAVLTPDREERAVAKADAAFGMTRPQTRNERIDALLHVFQAAVDALPELGELTGHYTVSGAVLRELNKVMQALRDNKIGGFKAND